MWSQILLIVASIFSTIVIYRRFKGLQHPALLAYITVILVAGGMTNTFLSYPLTAFTTQVLLLTAVLTGMVFLLISIRLLKPSFVRNSIIYAFLPYLVLPVYVFLLDSESLQLLIDATLQGTALVVLLILITGYFKTVNNSWVLFIGLIFFVVAYVTYWFVTGPTEINQIIVNCSVTIGVISISMKFPQLIKENKKD